MSWSRRFDEPIVLPDGKKLVTLKDGRRLVSEGDSEVGTRDETGAGRWLRFEIRSKPKCDNL